MTSNLVSLATVHHEGGCAPRDDLADPGTKGYTVGIGVTRYTFFRPPSESFATLHYNHVSFDVLLSGNRNDYPVTNTDIELIAAAAREGRARGWLIDAPYVRPHRESPGSSTICPGNHTAYPDPPTFPAGDPLTWLTIVTALHKEAPAPMPATPPHYFPPLGIVDMCAFMHPTLGMSAAAIDGSGHVFCNPPEAYMGSPYDDRTGLPKGYWGHRSGARIRAAKGQPGYIIESTEHQFYGPKF